MPLITNRLSSKRALLSPFFRPSAALMLSPTSNVTKMHAASIHLGLSLVAAACVAALVLGVWFPGPFAAMSGGYALLTLLVGVDVVVGPVLTFVVFNKAKPRRELILDLTFIGLLQLGALSYGLHTVFIARPVLLVFEADRFRAIAANDVYVQELSLASPEFQRLSLIGPKLLATRESLNREERTRALELALAGYDVGQRPSYWVPYTADMKAQALARSRPVADLIAHWPKQAPAIRADLDKQKLAINSTRFLPLQAKKGDWVVFLNPAGDPVGFSAHDGFF